MIMCAAVIGKKNQPLYLVTTKPDAEHEFHLIVHTSLDVIEDKVSSLGKGSSDSRDAYLGQLYPSEDYRVYGYLTNTQAKIVIVVDDLRARDNETREIFRAIHEAYTRCVCNPFYEPDTELTDKKFDARVRSIMEKSAQRTL